MSQSVGRFPVDGTASKESGSLPSPELSSVGMPPADMVLYTDGMLLDPVEAKTAHAVLRFAPTKVVAVCDDMYAGQRLGGLLPEFADREIPVLDEEQTLRLGGTVVIGFAPVGGALSPAQRAFVDRAAAQGRPVVNGLHDLLPTSGLTINLRAFDPADQRIARGVPLFSTRILTVGTSYSIGKMTTTALLAQGLAATGRSASWVATGQTGMLLQGSGCCIDAVPLDWVSGNIEHWVQAADAASEFVVVEGQGALFHPGFSGAVPILLHVARPQQMVLCHRLGQVEFGPTGGGMPTVEQAVESHDLLARALGVASSVTAVSLDSSRVSDKQYRSERDRVEALTGLPCCDPVRESVGPIVRAVVADARPRPASPGGRTPRGSAATLTGVRPGP